MRRRLALVSLLALAASCSDPSLTELLVVVDTDMDVPEQLQRVTFRVQGPDGAQQAALADLATGNRPAVLGMVHRGGPLGPFLISVTGERASGETVRQRRARVSFVEGRAMMLRMDLYRACDESVVCDAEQTCAAGECRSIDVAQDELVDWSENPPGLDGGMVIGADAGHDAGMPDAGYDGGVVICGDDGGICDDGVSCTMDSCAGMFCAFTPDDAMCTADMVDCTVARCDPVEGCIQQPQDAMCDDGVSCTVDTCDAMAGCSSTPSDAMCDDGVPCTVDACDAVAGCSSTPSDAACDDGIACTIDSCDAMTGCANTIDHSLCPPGELCDTAFTRACATGPTFTDVYAIVQTSCRPCHTQPPFEANLDMSSQAMAYSSLVGVTAVCGGGSNTRVIPNDATNSLLWRKLTGVNLCGEMMPRRMTMLPSSQITTIEQWINAGALNN